MSRIVLGVVLLLAVPSWAGPTADELEREVSASQEDLRAIEGLLDASGHAAVRRELARKLTRLQVRLEHIDSLRADLGKHRRCPVCEPCEVIVVNPDVPVVEPVIEVIEQVVDTRPVTSPQDLANIRSAVKRATFSKDKLSTLASAAKHRWFTADQVVTLLGEFTYGKDKVEAAVGLHPAVVDLENWYTVYAAFTYDSDRQKLRARVGDQ